MLLKVARTEEAFLDQRVDELLTPYILDLDQNPRKTGRQGRKPPKRPDLRLSYKPRGMGAQKKLSQVIEVKESSSSYIVEWG